MAFSNKKTPLRPSEFFLLYFSVVKKNTCPKETITQ